MKSNLIIIAATALILAACSTDEPEVNNGPVAIKVTASIDGTNTRAVNQTWAANDAIGVMAISSSSSASTINTLYKNVKYTVWSAGTAGTFTTTDDIYLHTSDGNVTFAAYYPYQTSTDKATLPGTDGVVTGANTLTQSTATAQSAFDYLYAHGATAYRSQPTLTFSGNNPFKHIMARLILVLNTSADDGFTASQVYASTTTFKLGGLKHDGTFNVTDGNAVATGSEVADWDITSNVNNVYNSGNGTRTYTMILYPQTIAAALTFSATVDGQTFSNTTAIQPALQAGYSYTYNITVKKTALVVSGCTIKEWNTGVNGSGDATL